jgi:hypothetical protein
MMYLYSNDEHSTALLLIALSSTIESSGRLLTLFVGCAPHPPYRITNGATVAIASILVIKRDKKKTQWSHNGRPQGRLK